MKKILSTVILLILIVTTSISQTNAWSTDTVRKNYPVITQKIDNLFIEIEDRLSSHEDKNFKKQIYNRIIKNIGAYEKKIAKKLRINSESYKKISMILSYIESTANDKINELETEKLIDLNEIFEEVEELPITEPIKEEVEELPITKQIKEKNTKVYHIESYWNGFDYVTNKIDSLWEFRIDSSEKKITLKE